MSLNLPLSPCHFTVQLASPHSAAKPAESTLLQGILCSPEPVRKAVEQPHLVKAILVALVPVPLVSGVVVVVTEQVAPAVALLAGWAAPLVHVLLLAAGAGHAGWGCRQGPGQSAACKGFRVSAAGGQLHHSVLVGKGEQTNC